MQITIPDKNVEEILGWLETGDLRGAHFFQVAITKKLHERQQVDVALEDGDPAVLHQLANTLSPGYDRMRVLAWLQAHENVYYTTE